MIRSSLFLMFDGISSEEFGILNVNIDSGMLSEHFSSSRSINETKTRGNDIPFFHEIKEEPLEFTCQLAVENTFTDNDLRPIRRWLLSPIYYTDLSFSEDPGKTYYALVIGQPELVHNGAGNGYIVVNFRTSAPWAYGSYISSSYDLSVNPSGSTKVITNNGDRSIYPIIEVYKIGDGDVTITNLSDSGQVLKFTDLKNGEIVRIDCNSEVFENSPLNTLTLSGSTSDGEIVSIKDRNYEFDTDDSVTTGNIKVDVSAGSTSSQSKTALYNAINTDVLSSVRPTLGATGDSIVVAGLNGLAGSDVATIETLTNGSWATSTLIDRNIYSLWNESEIKLLIGNNSIKFEGTGEFTVKFQPRLM